MSIEVEGLAKAYGDTRAVRGITFSVPAGEVCGYLGPNGAGKSTTLKIVAGILRASEGCVRVCGHDVSTEPLAAKRRIGYVPESGALYTLLSVSEHLDLVADLHDLEPGHARDRIRQVLSLFELEPLAHRRIDSLSKGQRQKVLLATALLPDPDVLLFDEPLNGLDARAARTVKEILHGLAARGRTVLYSSHILDVVERVCDRIVIIDDGLIVADAPTRELVADETLEGIFHELTRSGEPRGLAGAFLDG